MPISEIHWAVQANFPLLGALQLVPLLGALGVLFLKSDRLAFGLGLGLGLIELGLAIRLFQVFDAANPAFQLAEHLPLIGPLAYRAAADGITVLFVLLTAFLTLMLVLYGRIRPFEPQSRYLAVIFACEAALVGQFVTIDLLWFLLVSLVQVGAAGYLMHAWATSPEEGIALKRYFQFMGVGLALLAGGAGILGWSHADISAGGIWRFDLASLTATPVPDGMRSAVFYLMFYGLAIRIPLFPFHGWLPPAAEKGTVAPALIMLLGVKSGIYGLLRFVFPVVPEAVWKWHGYAVAFAVAGVFYAAILALMQQNLRRLLAYAVVSHTGILVIGLFSLHPEAFQGAILLAGNFGLAVAGMLLMVGMIYRRTQTLLLPRLGGLFDRLPLIGIAFLVAGLSVVAMPGTPGFDAAHLMLEAAIQRFGALVTIAAALGNVAAAGFLLWAFQRAFLAPPGPEAHAALGRVRRASPLETGIAVTIILVQLAAGFFSEPWMELVQTGIHSVSHHYQVGGHP